MKKITLITLVIALVLSAIGLTGCYEASEQSKTESAIQAAVAQQDGIYNKTEPIPLFNYSLPRHMWIQFYKSTTTKVIRTWTCEVGMDGKPLTEVQETVGYPIPMDTQLTNPQKLTRQWIQGSNGGSDGWVEGNLLQSEPNGLYTSPNTNATIYFTLGDDGQISPNYCEAFVVAKAYPFHWDEQRQIFVRDKGAKSSLVIDTKGAEGTKK